MTISNEAMTHKLQVTMPSDRELVMTRVFDAPRNLVFRVFTDPEAIPHWWGERAHATTVDHYDFQVGGKWQYTTRDNEGNQIVFSGKFEDIDPPARLVSSFEVEGSPEMISTDIHTFEERDGKTILSTYSRFSSREERDSMLDTGVTQGWGETLDRLEQHLEAMRELVVTRLFDAPRELVFAAFTGDGIEEWWGPNGFTTTTSERNVVPGGLWRFVMHGPDGTDWDNAVVYDEIIAPERLSWTQYAGDTAKPPHHYNTVTFTEQDGKTEVTLRMRIPSEAIFNQAMENGAIEGGHQTLNRLAEFLAKR